MTNYSFNDCPIVQASSVFQILLLLSHACGNTVTCTNY